MKTLVNKANPEIRISAPEIYEQKLTSGELVYEVNFPDNDGEDCCLLFDKTSWTLVENESPADQVQDMIDASDLTNEQKVNLLQDLSGYYMKKAHYETK